MDRYLVGILVAFGAVIAVNAVIMYFAFGNPPDVVESYKVEAR